MVVTERDEKGSQQAKGGGSLVGMGRKEKDCPQSCQYVRGGESRQHYLLEFVGGTRKGERKSGGMRGGNDFMDPSYISLGCTRIRSRDKRGWLRQTAGNEPGEG